MLFRIKLLDFCTFNIKPYNVRMNEFMNVSECILVHSWLERVLRVHRNDIQRQNSQILAPDGVSINNGSNQFVKFIVITRQGPLKCYVTQGGVSVFPEKSITEVYDSSTSLALRGGGGRSNSREKTLRITSVCVDTLLHSLIFCSIVRQFYQDS